MKNSKVVLASVAVAFLSGSVATASAQGAPDSVTGVPTKKMHVHGQAARTNIKTEAGYRPLTVGPKPAPTAADAVTGVGTAIATPFATVPVLGGAIGGATTLAASPLTGLFGGQPGISADRAPPLPIKARYANTGAVTTTLDDGYAQEVPVDRSGPIYMIDNGGKDRSVTPFSLVVFPITGATYAITQPLRAVTAPKS